MRKSVLLALSIIAIGMTGCGDTKSSSSSYSSPSTSGLSSDQKDRYNNLSSEGKREFDKQMRAYDNAQKR